MWKLKVLIQFILSKIPFGEKINYLLQVANRSHTDEKTGDRITELVTSMKKIDTHKKLEGAVLVEIGTGWEPICSALLYMFGVKKIYTYDHVRHLRPNLTMMVIRAIGKNLGQIEKISGINKNILEKRYEKIKCVESIDEFLEKSNIEYMAPGDASKTSLEAESVDIVFSHAVLEHVPKKVVHAIDSESKRILKKDGVAYHLIGLGDHYADVDPNVTTVNFLKFSEPLWAFFVKNRISYHNRLREKHFIKIFNDDGAKILWSENYIIPKDLEFVKTMKVHKDFEGMTPEELAVYRTEMLLSFS